MAAMNQTSIQAVSMGSDMDCGLILNLAHIFMIESIGIDGASIVTVDYKDYGTVSNLNALGTNVMIGLTM